MIEFKLPSLGSDMDEGTLNEWRVKPGDAVKRGQVVAIVETSKAAVNVEIWQDGTIYELKVPVGEKVPVGTVLATLLEPGELAQALSLPGNRSRAARSPPPPAKTRKSWAWISRRSKAPARTARSPWMT